MESTYCFKCGTASAPPSSSAHTEVPNPASSLASGAELTSGDKPYQALDYSARFGGAWAPRWASRAVQGSCRWPFPSLPALSPSACPSMHGLPCSQGDEVTAHGSRGPTVSYTISTEHFRVHLAWWLSGKVYVPGGLEFEPQRLRGFSGLPGV